MFKQKGFLDGNDDINLNVLKKVATNEYVIKYYDVCEKIPKIKDKIENVHNFILCILNQYMANLKNNN